MGGAHKKQRKARGRVGIVGALVLALTVVLVACGTESPLSKAPAAPAETSQPTALDPAAEALRAQLNPVPLRQRPADYFNERQAVTTILPGTPDTSLRSMAVANHRVAMKVLVIGTVSPSPDDVNVGAAMRGWTELLDQAGIPYDTYAAVERGDITYADLIEPDGTGKYYAVLLISNDLAHQVGDGHQSAFTSAGWTALFDYEREYGVRQVTLATRPTSNPESFGVTEITPVPTPADRNATSAVLADEGRQVFRYLAADAEIGIINGYAYPSVLTPASNAVPLLRDPAGNILAVTSVADDGRERLAVMFAGGSWGHRPDMHLQLLGKGLIEWATRGVYLGQRQMFLGADIDDWFADADWWEVSESKISDDRRFDLDANDAHSFARQQAALRTGFAGVVDDFTWTMAYNGGESDPTAAGLDCADLPAVLVGVDLSSITRCVAQDFWWVNHTLNHWYMDHLDYAQSYEQIHDNEAFAVTFDFAPNHSPRSLVTGDISGLGWYADEVDVTPKVDRGLQASNPHFLEAAKAAGKSFVASNMSTPSHEPDCVGCGIYHPLEASIFLVPRWPTNVFASVGTPEAAVDAFNAWYGVNGAAPDGERLGYDVNYQQYLEMDTNAALEHILSGSPYQHYFHVVNMHEYEPGKSLLADWAETLLRKYQSLVNLPLRSLQWDELGDFVQDRTSFLKSGLSGVWDRTARTITITSVHGGMAFVTGVALPGGSTYQYGSQAAGDLISSLEMTAGQTVTLAAVGSTPPMTSSDFQVAVQVDAAQGAVIGLSNPYSLGAPLSLTAVPNQAWIFAGWSGDIASTDNPLAYMVTGSLQLVANFQAKPTQLIDFPELGDRATTDAPFQVSAASDSGLPVAFTAAGVCTVDGATVTLTGDIGSCTITAWQSGDDTYAAATPVQRSFEVTDPISFTLTVAVDGNGTVAVDRETFTTGQFVDGSVVTLTALPATGWRFVGWDAAGTDAQNPLAVTVTATVTLTAYFAPEAGTDPEPEPALHNLTTAVAGPGFGLILTSPAGPVCADDCTQAVEEGNRVTLVAVPLLGSSFGGWAGACTGTGGCTITIDEAKKVQASFGLGR